MQTSLFLAKLIGPVLVLACAGALINRASLPELINEFLVSRALLFLIGAMEVTLGLSIVLTHNVWVADWRIIVTLIGWLLLIRGAARLLVPARLKEAGGGLVKRPTVLTVAFAVAVLLGLVLCYFGYAR